MVSQVRYVCRSTTYKEIKEVLDVTPKLRSFPVVDDAEGLFLLGSVSRCELVALVRKQLNENARKDEALRRIRTTVDAIKSYAIRVSQRRNWEAVRLKERVKLCESIIDQAPFQLVRRTSLHKVHALFSLLHLRCAYVIDRGRLVGVVGLTDLRKAIENAYESKSNRRDETWGADSDGSIATKPTVVDERRNSMFQVVITES
ncbi:unnamed protein product [Anisakis simplex]|uniref:CBS domain-containing protein n=1 Tax=Anisakis simplex TaxID=6269 RepID=A0A0M3K117_ANISI|nr:unnamed protein product [Anisakis simplex]